MRFQIVLLLAAASVAGAQECPSSPIDEFKTNQAIVLAKLFHINDPNDKFDKPVPDSAAPGGFRRYVFRNIDNRFGQTAELSLRPDPKSGGSALVVSAGVRQAVALEVHYGQGKNLQPIPLHLKPPKVCDRIRLTFDSNSHQLNVFSQINVPGVGLLSSEAIVPGTDHAFCVDFFLAKFLPAQPTPPDLSQTGIDGLHLVLQPEGAIGAHDYAIKRFEFAGTNTKSVGPCIVAP